MKLELSASQLAILAEADEGFSTSMLTSLLAQNEVKKLSLSDLVLILEAANATYRAGFPLLSDAAYDGVYIAELKRRNPKHSFLQAIEPETMVSAKTVALPQKMLSTDKAYSLEDVRRWLNRLLKACEELGLKQDELEIRVTPKLDGYAAFDDGKLLYTRGDGIRGQDISRAFTRGLQVAQGAQRGLGAGEIVINKSYFDDKLSSDFENARNIQASIIAEKNIDPKIQLAISEGACVFYPFIKLPNWQGAQLDLLDGFEQISEQIWNAVDYEVDGIILEATDAQLKSYLGSTRRHNRWQIAYKINQESVDVRVNSVTGQTSRTGRITPVAELVPTRLSGALLSRATVHHYGMVKANGVGAGALVQLVRSGLVIPKIEKVLEPVSPDIPSHCMSCGSEAVWDGDNLLCPNSTQCPAQLENTLVHFFAMLANVDGFGPQIIAKLYEHKVQTIHHIYELSLDDYVGFGFGTKTATNLLDQLHASRHIEIEDWRFLAAFGIPRLGLGNSERLLQHVELHNIFNLKPEDIAEMEGFAEKSGIAIHAGLLSIREEFDKLFALGFTLQRTPKISDEADATAVLRGLQVVFTGTMLKASRAVMEKQAKALGARVSKSVSAKTSYLVVGEKVGAKKTQAAQDKGVKILSEDEYITMIAGLSS